MTTTESNEAIVKVLNKPGYKSKTFTATMFIELLFMAAFWLSLHYNVDPAIGSRVRSGIVLAMAIVALGYIAPQIAHDILTRIPLAKGMAPEAETKPPAA